MIVSVIALICATSGTSLAAGHYLISSSKQIKPGTISLADLSKSAQKQLIGKSGAHGPSGAPGTAGATGPIGATGADGAAGVNGSARAYGRFDGTKLVTASSKNIVSIANPATGTYCITAANGITPTDSILIVAPDDANDQTFPANHTLADVEWSSVSNACPAGTFQVVSLVVSASGSALALVSASAGFAFMIP
jgi:hypothetical protein